MSPFSQEMNSIVICSVLSLEDVRLKKGTMQFIKPAFIDFSGPFYGSRTQNIDNT